MHLVHIAKLCDRDEQKLSYSARFQAAPCAVSMGSLDGLVFAELFYIKDSLFPELTHIGLTIDKTGFFVEIADES